MGPGLLLLFIVGDILGTGVYALTGKVAAFAFAGNLDEAFGLDLPSDGWALVGVALLFMTAGAVVDRRGVAESVRLNVVVTCVELSGLLIIVAIGAWAIGHGQGALARATEFHAATVVPVLGALTCAFLVSPLSGRASAD